MRRLRDRLSYANVVASLALFAALGGTSYAAVSLSRNSVGAREIRAKAVGGSELRSSAVRSRHLAAGSVTARKLSRSARRDLRGATGPAGPVGPAGASPVTFRASVELTGAVVRGSPAGSQKPEVGRYELTFGRDLSQCTPVATLGRVEGGPRPDEPPPGRITAAASGSTIVVRTFGADGKPDDISFNLIVAC